MKTAYVLTIVSAGLLAAGCAHEQERARYDENISPSYSGGRMSNFNSDHSAAISSAATAGGNFTSGKTSSESDNAVVASVRELLRRNAEIAPIVPNIQISANNGAVVLSGAVQSDAQKRQIEILAQQATGVVAVNNQLEVVSIPRQTSIDNQASNPLLNPTSVVSNNPPALYQNAGSAVDNTNALTPSSPTSTASNSPPRLYQDAAGSDSSSNALNQTSRTNGEVKVYEGTSGGPSQTTNSDLSPSESPMH